jgi:hypothetical protein
MDVKAQPNKVQKNKGSDKQFIVNHTELTKMIIARMTQGKEQIDVACVMQY